MSALEKQLAISLDRRRTHSRLRQLKFSLPGTTDFSSNDFLSLATTNALRKDLVSEIENHQLPTGSTGSRLLDGNSEYAERLESDIAAFHGAEAGLLTNSGFDANVSIFTCIPQSGDIIVYDELIHASVHDGMKQSRASALVQFKHNCMIDLRRVLESYSDTSPHQNVFVATESLYSMDGDLAPLQEIISIIDETFRYQNCHLIVDEAHATGIYGPKGRGRVSELGLESKVLIRLHTFGKALACNGAIILCSNTIKQYLLNYARPLIYTTFMSYPSLMAIKVIYDWLKAGKTEQLASRLLELIRYMHDRMETMKGLIPMIKHRPLLQMASQCPQSPIFALITNEPRSLAACCQSAGFVVRAVVPPTVPEGTARVRVCLHADNTFDQIDRFIGCVKQWVIQRSTAYQSMRVDLNNDSKQQKRVAAQAGPLLMPRKKQGRVGMLPSKL